MASQVGITLIKKFNYRGVSTEEYSNQYWLTGSVPSTGTDWQTLIDDLIAEEKTVYASQVKVVQAYAYDSDADGASAVYSYDTHSSPIDGTLSVGSATSCPGDCAVWVRWKTDRLNSKGKPIYLRKYFHVAWYQTASGADVVATNQRTALEAFATTLSDGSFTAGRTITARGHSDTIDSIASSAYVTTRTLKRRGKRPGS
jgi:hypothetical protein